MRFVSVISIFDLKWISQQTYQDLFHQLFYQVVSENMLLVDRSDLFVVLKNAAYKWNFSDVNFFVGATLAVSKRWIFCLFVCIQGLEEILSWLMFDTKQVEKILRDLECEHVFPKSFQILCKSTWRCLSINQRLYQQNGFLKKILFCLLS